MLKLPLVIGLCVVPLVVSFHLNPIEDAPWNEEPLELEEQLGKNVTVSLDQFEVYHQLGKGAFGKVFVAKKLGGPDHGAMYALKVIELTEFSLVFIENLNTELLIMIAVRDLPFSIRLHYAFQQGKYLFLVMDFSTGGDLLLKMKNSGLPNAATTRIILTELITCVEAMHNARVFHKDLNPKNVLIDNEGHLRVIDYGVSTWLTEGQIARLDWSSLSREFGLLLRHLTTDEQLTEARKLLENMSLIQLPGKVSACVKFMDMFDNKLKRLPYFHGIDWQQVSERKSIAPFDPSETEVELNKPQNKTALFNSEMDDETAAIIAQKFLNYTFVAREHRN